MTADKAEKEALAKAYISELIGEPLDADAVKLLSSKGYIDSRNRLTDSGRSNITVVMAGGVFDIIHPGHVYFLRKAKELGDVLVVVVARDINVLRFKGVQPIHNESLRRELVSAIRYVDAAILGDESDLMKTVERVRPDIIALGYDQVHDERWLEEESRKRGLSVRIVRLDTPYPNIKSRNIKSDPRFGQF